MVIVLVGHRTDYTRPATTATIPRVIMYPAWSSRRMVDPRNALFSTAGASAITVLHFWEDVSMTDSYRILSDSNMAD